MGMQDTSSAIIPIRSLVTSLTLPFFSDVTAFFSPQKEIRDARMHLKGVKL